MERYATATGRRDAATVGAGWPTFARLVPAVAGDDAVIGISVAGGRGAKAARRADRRASGSLRDAIFEQ